MTKLDRMTNDEGMTKSEDRNSQYADDSFWNNDAESVIREEPVKQARLRFGRAHGAIR